MLTALAIILCMCIQQFFAVQYRQFVALTLFFVCIKELNNVTLHYQSLYVNKRAIDTLSIYLSGHRGHRRMKNHSMMMDLMMMSYDVIYRLFCLRIFF